MGCWGERWGKPQDHCKEQLSSLWEKDTTVRWRCLTGDGNKLSSVLFPDPICTLPVLKGNAELRSVLSYFGEECLAFYGCFNW